MRWLLLTVLAASWIALGIGELLGQHGACWMSFVAVPACLLPIATVVSFLPTDSSGCAPGINQREELMLPTTHIRLSQHALERFHERVDCQATGPQIISRVRNAWPIPNAWRARLKELLPHRLGQFNRTSSRLYVSDEDAVYVLGIEGVGDFSLITVFSREMILSTSPHRETAEAA